MKQRRTAAWRHDQPWYESFFGRDYLDVYGYQFTDERAEAETEFAIRALALKPGERVLDLCCGQGRHAVLLARHGCDVTALDLSAEYLELAQTAARAAGVKLETVHADMREIPFRATASTPWSTCSARLATWSPRRKTRRCWTRSCGR